MNAKRAVTISLGASATVVVVSKAMSGQWPSPRIFFGFAVVYVILGFTADLSPELAVPFAVLVFVAVLLSQGGNALGGISKSVNRQKRKSSFQIIQGGKVKHA